MPRSLPRLCVLLLPILLLAACGGREHAQGIQEGSAAPADQDYATASGHAPPFARLPYEPFTRADAVAIAIQEWQLFGQPVRDEPPGTRPPPPAYENPARVPGHWERIGEYWWLGQNSNRREAAWTGKHDESGREFDDRYEDYYAWSAAFISYVMRTAGAGVRFPYAPSHYIYINTAARMTQGLTNGWVVYAERPEDYAPQLGDLICTSRERRPIRYAQLPGRRFAGHCDIVVAINPGQLSVIGGNVGNAVSMKHVPITPDGKLATPDGEVLDWRFPWFVVLRVMYDR